MLNWQAEQHLHLGNLLSAQFSQEKTKKTLGVSLIHLVYNHVNSISCAILGWNSQKYTMKTLVLSLADYVREFQNDALRYTP